MKRLFSLLLAVCCLCISLSVVFAETSENTLVVVILDYKSNAENVPIEEAFFKMHPEATIEYRLYTTEQFTSLLLNGQCDADIVIADYPLALSMAQKGYSQTLDTIGLTEYPEQLIDLSRLLMYEGKLIGLPFYIVEECFFWDSGAARKAGVSNPAADGYWTWEDFAELCRQLPKDTDGDGEPDVYLMYGSALANCPYLQNANVDMFLNFNWLHPERIDQFFDEYLDLFREVLTSDAYLNMYSERKNQCSVIISVSGGINPLLQSGNLIPGPAFSEDENYHVGGLISCVLMKNAQHQELAADFLRGMLSSDALSLCDIQHDYYMMGQNPPTRRITNMKDLLPTFTDVNGIQTAYVKAGRRYFTAAYSVGEYATAQEYRKNVLATTFPGAGDFHGAVWANLQDWYLGNITDEELKENVVYLVQMAMEE